MKKILFRFILVFCVSIIFYCDTVQAAEMKYGNYSYTVSNKEVTITEYTGNDSKVSIPSKIRGLKVTSIGEASFVQKLYQLLCKGI